MPYLKNEHRQSKYTVRSPVGIAVCAILLFFAFDELYTFLFAIPQSHVSSDDAHELPFQHTTFCFDFGITAVLAITAQSVSLFAGTSKNLTFQSNTFGLHF